MFVSPVFGKYLQKESRPDVVAIVSKFLELFSLAGRHSVIAKQIDYLYVSSLQKGQLSYIQYKSFEQAEFNIYPGINPPGEPDYENRDLICLYNQGVGTSIRAAGLVKKIGDEELVTPDILEHFTFSNSDYEKMTEFITKVQMGEGVIEAPDNSEIKIVKGADIAKYYLQGNYKISREKDSGSLTQSCMRYENKNRYIKTYPALFGDNVAMAIIYHPNEDKISARCLIWGNQFHDRIYHAEKKDEIRLRAWLEENRYICMNGRDGNAIANVKDAVVESQGFQSQPRSHFPLPYLDSFRHCSTDAKYFFFTNTDFNRVSKDIKLHLAKEGVVQIGESQDGAHISATPMSIWDLENNRLERADRFVKGNKCVNIKPEYADCYIRDSHIVRLSEKFYPKSPNVVTLPKYAVDGVITTCLNNDYVLLKDVVDFRTTKAHKADVVTLWDGSQGLKSSGNLFEISKGLWACMRDPFVGYSQAGRILAEGWEAEKEERQAKNDFYINRYYNEPYSTRQPVGTTTALDFTKLFGKDFVMTGSELGSIDELTKLWKQSTPEEFLAAQDEFAKLLVTA